MALLDRVLLCTGLLATVCGGSALAQDNFPSKPIHVVVTFPPGGGTDLLARLIGAELQKSTNQTVIVDNRPGASGNIGAQAVARSPADGYTLLMVNSSFAINPGVFKKMPFDPKADFTAVVNVAYVPSVVVVPADSPYKTLADLMAAARQGKGAVSFGSCGNGTPQHLAGEMINVQAKTSLQHVPYKGCGPALTDVLGQQVASAIVTASSAMPYVSDGKLRALAVTSKARSSFLPDVPTVAEQGLPGYELDQWHGFLAPAGTPKPVIAKLHNEIARIVGSKAMRERLLQLNYAPASSSAEEFQKLIEADIDRFASLSQRIGLRVD